MCFNDPDFLSTEEWYGLARKHDNNETPTNYNIARKCYEIIITKSNGRRADALHHLGILYEYGQGVDKNLEEAIIYYGRAAELGWLISKEKVIECKKEIGGIGNAINWAFSLFGSNTVVQHIVSKKADKMADQEILDEYDPSGYDSPW